MKNILKIEIDSNRVYGLDILRAFAILFVVIEHGSFLLPKPLKKINSFFIFDGVSIFFVLSGFLIGGILIKILNKDEITKNTLRSFWIRRWFRTLPNYFLILILLTVLNCLFTTDFALTSVSKYFIFSQNLFEPHPPIFFPEAWSLSVEEWFYLTVPLLIFIAIRFLKITPKKSVLYTAIFILTFVTLFRYYRFATHDFQGWDLYFRKQVITRLDSLMYGVIGAYIQFYSYEKWSKHKNALFALGLILFLVARFIMPKITSENGLYSTVISFSVISLATLFLLPFLSDLKTGKGLLFKCFTYISLISYSMYLLNYTVIQRWILKKIDFSSCIHNHVIAGCTIYAAYWFLVIVLSILLYKYFEIPMTKLRDKQGKH